MARRAPKIDVDDDQAERIAWAARFLSHPLRVRVLVTLHRMEEGSPRELSGEIGADLAVVSHHVRYLREGGAIELVRETPRRGALEHHYRLCPRMARALTVVAGLGEVAA